MALGTLLLPQPLLAQRTEDNATTAAEDGFGRSVGNESVGSYANGQVRGFSAADAGNTRIESLYIDEVGGPLRAGQLQVEAIAITVTAWF